MRLSTRARYGVRGLCALAVMSKDAPASIGAIAERENLSKQYLAIIFHELRKAGFVATERGVKGGYQLAVPADEITVAQVVTALDGPIHMSDCVGSLDEARPYSGCKRQKTCPSRPAWVKLQNAIDRVLSSMTIASLISDD